jgi:hypothetical protein
LGVRGWGLGDRGDRGVRGVRGVKKTVFNCFPISLIFLTFPISFTHPPIHSLLSFIPHPSSFIPHILL